MEQNYHISFKVVVFDHFIELFVSESQLISNDDFKLAKFCEFKKAKLECIT